MRKRAMLSKKRNLNANTRRKQLLKQLHRKMVMRRHDFQMQVELSELAEAS